jgi:D-alanine-D-alanine ligase
VDLESPRQIPGLLSDLRRERTIVFLALHGPFGEDGTVQGLLDLSGIPYTGSGQAASALAMDKVRAKARFVEQGIPTPEGTVESLNGSVRFPRRFPVVVKPSAQGSAVGVEIAESRSGLLRAVRRAFRYGDQVLVERCIRGRELTVGVLEGQALPVVEIVTQRKFYDYTAKYSPGMSLHRVPAPISGALTRQAQRLAERACRALGCSGGPRVDMMLDDRGRFFVLEVNTLPGMTATSLMPEAAAAAGISFPELTARLIRDAERKAGR